ncbi:hypothetical protein FGO68_gene5084 [Halteria grandinella]|uniref:Uncharacterized protein n=1 Tax=Halteria grandinella TaxID=5974 RepID=A0A8J8T4Y9_HALGN|nr:hypothetical protein FGO68_gene5084 [Halteria grandinella]
MVLQGPSEMLGIPDNNYCVLTGFALNGVAQGFIFIPLLPDALEAVFVKENIVEGQNEQLDQLISDYGSGLYGTFFSIGQILAPILGGALYESIDYRPTTDFMTLVCLGWCVIFFVFNVGFKIYAKEKKIHAKMVMLSELQQAKSDEERNQSLNHNGSNRKLAKDEDEQEEEIEEFLRRQREKWKQIRDNTAKNHTKQGQTNNLSSIRESKNEGTFLESKAGTGTVQPYQFTGIGAGMQLNENTYSQSNTQSAAGYTPIMSSQRGKRKISGDVENDELQQHLIEQKMKDLQKH